MERYKHNCGALLQYVLNSLVSYGYCCCI